MCSDEQIVVTVFSVVSAVVSLQVEDISVVSWKEIDRFSRLGRCVLPILRAW